MISAGQLAQLQRASNRLLPDQATIQRRTLTADSSGGQTEAWANLATVACRVSPAQYRAGEPVIADRVTAQGDYTVTFPAGTDVTAKDRLLWSGKTLEVVSVAQRSWEIVRRVSANEMT